jgi:peptide/nickel transport system substrate-binding protein
MTGITRRALGQVLAGGAALALPGGARAQNRKGVLVIGLDISDTITLDPARQSNYSPPLTLAAAYDTLVTMGPPNYLDLQPCLATQWARTPDGKGWRFTLRDGVKFNSGAAMTADDVKWSLDRVIGVKDQPVQYIGNIDSVAVVDPKTIDIVLKDPAEPILTILCAPAFIVYERKVVEAQGGKAGPTAGTEDKATEWLNTHSAGTGPYTISGWARNSQIQLVANPHSWRGAPAFQRIIIRHIPESAAQLLAVQRGDVDAAFNLIPEQIKSLADDPKLRVEGLMSLDFVYLAVTQNGALNPALAHKAARQAIGWAIDYDGIRDSLLGGKAVRPACFLPIGMSGSTEAIAKEIGFRQDLDKSKALLAQAGLGDGFEFELSYGQAAIAGISYQTLAQKLQADLARVGIRAKLNPMDQVNMRTQYLGAKSQGALTFWNPPAVENELWAAASVQRVAKRVGWVPPAAILALVTRAASETDPAKQAALWVEYQKFMLDEADLIVLFQPVYQVAVSQTVKKFPLTAAGWLADLGGAG